MKRDDKNRIVHFDSDGYIIDTTYDDTPAMQVVAGKNISVWKFKSIIFRHPDGRTKTIEKRGFVVMEDQPAALLCSPFAPPPDDGGLGSMNHYHDGMKAAADPGDLKGKDDWISDHLGRVGAAWNAAKNALGGQGTANAAPVKFDPTHHTATPANTGKQRIALSAFVKK